MLDIILMNTFISEFGQQTITVITETDCKAHGILKKSWQFVQKHLFYLVFL